jgi:Mg2+-importing ATPase
VSSSQRSVRQRFLDHRRFRLASLLVQNLLYDLSQSMIPFDNVDDDFIAKPIEWSIPSMIRFMLFFGPTSSIFDIVTFSLNWWFWGIQSDADSTVPVAQ